jgi:two-component system, NtrC family, nitrogen regulation sensor histidine kinase NtrY
MKFGWMKVLPFVMAVLLIALALGLWPTTHGGLLAWINISLLLMMALMVLRYGVRLVRERGESRPGSRLRAKLVMALVGMLLVPSMILQLAASQMVERGMDVWFNVRVDTLLDRALGLAQGFYSRIQTELEHGLRTYMTDTTLLIAMDDQNFSAITSRLSDIRAKEGWRSLQLFDASERLIAGVDAESLSTLTAEPLSDAARSAMTLGRVVTELQQVDGRESVVGYAPLQTPQGLVGLLRAEVQLPQNVVQTSRMVEEDYKSYRELERNRQSIRELFAHVMLLVTLMVVFVAGIVALIFARRLTAPIGELAYALGRITEGDLTVSIPEAPQDELGLLVRSFNRMAVRLRENVQALEQAQEDLTEALTSSRQRQYVLETLLGNLQSGVMLDDGEGRVRLVNQSFKTLLSLPDEWGSGSEVRTGFGGRLQPVGEFYEELADHAEGQVQREFELMLGQRPLHILARGVRLTSVGSASFSGQLLVLDDISSLAEAQRSKAWAEVAQRLAHEIKNPLTPIKLAAERLQRRFRADASDTTVFDTCTQAIIGQVERMQRLIADFSTLARMPKPRMQQASIAAILREMRELFSAYGRVEVKVPTKDVRCECDPDQIKQILINLLDNGLAATTEKGKVRLSMVLTDGMVEFHVKDDGIGIPEDTREYVFQDYYSTKPSGSGLGLSIARRIAEDHGGELVLESAGHPTHFCLRLPMSHMSMAAA